jgi:hypothetical protein
MAGDVSGRGGTSQESYAGDFPGLLRLRHSPARYECEGESKHRHPFWFAGPLLDCRFWIIGLQPDKFCKPHLRHENFLRIQNPKSKIQNSSTSPYSLPFTPYRIVSAAA